MSVINLGVWGLKVMEAGVWPARTRWWLASNFQGWQALFPREQKLRLPLECALMNLNSFASIRCIGCVGLQFTVNDQITFRIMDIWPIRTLQSGSPSPLEFARRPLERFIRPWFGCEFPPKMALLKYYAPLGLKPWNAGASPQPIYLLQFSWNLQGCAAHSEDCPACEADHANLLSFTNNELGQISR